MENPPLVQRHYNVPDDIMLQTANAMLGSFTADLADFTSFAASFNSAYKTQWQADITAAEEAPTDESIEDQQQQLSETVEAAMTAARNKWSELKFFAKKAFPESKAKQAEFGADDYDNARKSQTGMIKFMEQAHATAEKYKTTLIAKDYTQIKIDEIGSLGAALHTADKAQESFKRERRGLTEERIKLLNKPYDTMMEVAEAAQVIFADSAAKLAEYTFDPTGDAMDGPGDYEGSIAGNETKEAAHVVYGTGRALSFLNTGSTELQFYLTGGALEPEGTSIVLASGGSANTLMGNLNATGNHIIVRNTDPTIAGGYKVTVGPL